MTKLDWKAICNKTKFASHKKRLTKRELGELMDNVVALNKFLAGNKSNFAEVDRREKFNLTQH